MTDKAKLIERARITANYPNTLYQDWSLDLTQMADALEALQAENERLKGDANSMLASHIQRTLAPKPGTIYQITGQSVTYGDGKVYVSDLKFSAQGDAMEQDSEQLRKDIEVLLVNLDFMFDVHGDDLEPGDMAMIAEVRERSEAVKALPAPPEAG